MDTDVILRRNGRKSAAELQTAAARSSPGATCEHADLPVDEIISVAARQMWHSTYDSGH